MDYLCEIIGTDTAGNLRTRHLPSGMNIILGSSKKNSDCRRLRRGDTVSCSSNGLRKGRAVYFSSNYRATGRDYKTLLKEGMIRRIFYDKKSGDTLVVGMWNSYKDFEEFDEIPSIIGFGKFDFFLYAFVNFNQQENFYRAFSQQVRERAVIANFDGLLRSALGQQNTLEKIMLAKLVDSLSYPIPKGLLNPNYRKH